MPFCRCSNCVLQITDANRGMLMKSRLHLNDRNTLPRNRYLCRPSIALALLLSVVFQSAPAINALGATIEFDASATSLAVIAFDPDAIDEGHDDYVTGANPAVAAGPVLGTDMNAFLGADAFYDRGYTGTNAVIANIEAGHIWSGHETLTHVLQIPNNPAALNEFDRHATWVGMILGGRRGGANPGAYQEGMAPNAQLYSGAFASQWNGERFTISASDSNAVKFDQYRRAFSTGVNADGRRADVINTSAGTFESTNGSGTIAIGLDGFANTNPRTLLVVSTGNQGPGPDKVSSPAAGYNNLSVAALGPSPPYNRPATFSSGGPNDYADPVHGTANNARQVVDIAAPGQNLSSAYYGGETGGNGQTDNPAVSGPGPTGPPDGPLGGPNFYQRGGLQGTSFAAPTVAGGAALLYDAAYSVFSHDDDARDARVMKAVLMNSADKTIGWDNGQVAHPNGNGGVLTTQGLDNRVGTGRLNLHAAYDQFLSGTTDVPGSLSGNLGLVKNTGWDFGDVVSPTTNDYYFGAPLLGGSTFTATLTWFRDRRIDSSNTVFDDSYADLNLELWSVVDGTPTSLISESSSLFNNSEHFSFALPFTGDYALRVRWFKEVFNVASDVDQEFYGLAWSAVTGLPSDFDRDGRLSANDVQAMLVALTDLTAYETAQGLSDATLVLLGDLNGDHAITNADIQPLLDLIASSNGSAPTLPEPSALVLLAMALIALVIRHSVVLLRPSRVLQIAAALFPLVAFADAARADIFQWEYINPADPTLGKRQSKRSLSTARVSMPCPAPTFRTATSPWPI